MAINYVGMKTFGRSSGKRGSRAPSAAAYRAGERIRDERTGAVYDHRRRRDVMHKEIVLPAKLARAGRELDWARNRATLWNAAEHAEVRRNARVAREFVVGLPHELSHGQRTLLARQFAQELANRYGNAIDVAIHAPRGDPRNFHAHLLATTREVTPDGLASKTTLELSGTERHRLGLPRWMDETKAIRERWAELANRALENAHLAARVPPVGFTGERQRLSAPRVPFIGYRIEQRGGRSFVAERIRATHRQMQAGAGMGPAPFAVRTGILRQLWGEAQKTWVSLSGMLRAHAPSESTKSPPAHESEFATHRSAFKSEPTRDPIEGAPESGPVRGPAWQDELAAESARKWARQYGPAARQGHAAVGPDAARTAGLDREQEHAREHARERDDGYGYDLEP